MKRKLLTSLAASAVLLLLAIGCKKENPTAPVNFCGVDTTCSFCFGDILETGADSLIISTNYAHQTTFLKNGQLVGLSPIANETPTGFYGWQGGVSIALNGANIPLACGLNKVTFVHARVPNGSSNVLVNVQFPGTPLISTSPDSLQYYLTPYGYTVENYSNPGTVWMNTTGGFYSGGIVDSIIVRGPDFGTVTIGADLFESELRSICVAYE